MKYLLACALLFLFAAAAVAESQVFSPIGTPPEEVAATVRALYGEQVRVEVVNQRLVVIGSAKQLAEIGELVTELERVPAPLRLSLSETPPLEDGSATVYRSGVQEYRIDTVEGALVELEASRLGERAAADGWSVMVEEVPVRIDALVLNLQLQGDEVLVTYSFTRRHEDERRVYGNRQLGTLGRWMALLPQIEGRAPNTYSTTAAGRRGQLYLKVERGE